MAGMNQRRGWWARRGALYQSLLNERAPTRAKARRSCNDEMPWEMSAGTVEASLNAMNTRMETVDAAGDPTPGAGRVHRHLAEEVLRVEPRHDCQDCDVDHRYSINGRRRGDQAPRVGAGDVIMCRPHHPPAFQRRSSARAADLCITASTRIPASTISSSSDAQPIPESHGRVGEEIFVARQAAGVMRHVLRPNSRRTAFQIKLAISENPEIGRAAGGGSAAVADGAAGF